MAQACVLNVDLAEVYESPDRKGFVNMLAWGDEVTVENVTDNYLEISTVRYDVKPDGSVLPVTVKAYICPKHMKPAAVVVPAEENRVLKVNFIDVQQGDGAVVELPSGQVMLIDGGENQLFARYLAGRFRGTSLENPKQIDCILVTHGDVDHFAGLPMILDSEKNKEPQKRLFVKVKHVFHNGLVKRYGKTADGKRLPDVESLGETQVLGGVRIVTDLADDLRDVPDEKMNVTFQKWKRTLVEWDKREPLACRRLSFGDDAAFDFLKRGQQDLEFHVLGPITTTAGCITGLRFLGNAPEGPRLGQDSVNLEDKVFTGLSSSHTINGHSIVLKMRYGGFSFLLAGDLNDQAGRALARMHQAGEIDLRSDVLKVPHHGSADFSGAFLEMVSPVVSVISCGDESARKEFIHPRATLMGALGRHSRVLEPLVFVTELAAFFDVEGWSNLSDAKKATKRGEFFGFSRTAFGCVKTRTDGKRLLVYTDSGKKDTKEAYAYALDAAGEPVPSAVVKV